MLGAVTLAILGGSTRWGAVLAAVLVAVLAFAGEAEASWLAPFPISSLGVQATDPQVAANGHGDITVAWTSGTGNTGIMVTEHTAGGLWTFPIERIPSSSDCHDPRLSVNAAGAAVLVADCDDGTALMRSASRGAVGGWSSSVALTGTGGGTEPRVGIDSGGNAAMVFAGSGNTVQAGYLPAGMGWSSIVQLSTAEAFEPNIAMTPTGAADAAWRQKGSGSAVEVRVARKQGSAAWGSSGSLSGATAITLGEPRVEATGEWQIVAWTQQSSGVGFMRERTSHGDNGAFVEPAVALSETGSVEEPALAIDSGGRSVTAWRSSSVSYPSGFEVRGSATAFSNGSWASPGILEEAGPGGSTSAEVAVDAGGEATLAWNTLSTIRATRRPSGGAFAPTTTISNASNDSFGVPFVAADLGDVVVAWPASAGGSHIALAIGDFTAPALTPSSPASVPVGTPVALSATATDTWGSPTFHWDLGDGASANGTSVSHAYASAGTKTATVTATDGAGNSASAPVQVVVTSPAGDAGGVPGSDPSGTDPGVGGPGPAGPKDPAPRHHIQVTAAEVAQPWTKQAKAKAISVRCELDVAGTCAAVATVTKSVAKRLGLPLPKGMKPIRIGRGSAPATANRFAVVKVKLNAQTLAAVPASAKPVPVAIALTGTAPGDDPRTASRHLTLRP